MSQEINAIFDLGYFKKIVMGAVTVSLRECGYNKHQKAEVLYECKEVLDKYSAEKLLKPYQVYLVNGK